MRYIYNFLLSLILPFIPLRLWWQGRKNSAYRKRWRERFALYDFLPLPESIWIHAVSLGEAIAAIPLIKSLKNEYPEKKIVVTTMTPTGAGKLQEVFGKTILQLYVTYDHPWIVQKFLERVKPVVLIIIETELWPNILHYTSRRKIPIILVNARLSQKSFGWYKRIKPLVKEMLNCITYVAAQSKKDGERFLKLALAPQKLVIAGNIKFDIELPTNIKKEALDLGRSWKLNFNRPILIAASTHLGEEEKILEAMREILEKMPKALLILVPRHPERFDQTAFLCNKKGFKTIRYSRNDICTDNVEIVVGDVVGKLLTFYSLADVAFVGGSLVPAGGHNLLEPAAVGLPILTGPYLTNFSEISRLLIQAEALLLVNETTLAKTALDLFTNKELSCGMVKRAYAVIFQNKGALKQLLHLVKSV